MKKIVFLCIMVGLGACKKDSVSRRSSSETSSVSDDSLNWGKMPEFAPPAPAQKAGPPKPTQTKKTVKTAQVDPLGVRMIYPSKPGGQAWFMNMSNPESDKRFDPKGTITRNSDGSWKMRDDQVRMNVFTTSGYKPSTIITNQKQLASRGYMQDPNDWRNVEVTGYVRVNSAGEDDNFT
jgi:hypothetical protein